MKSTFTREYATVLEVLIRTRKRNGLSQTTVASALGKPQSFVSKYENGERRVDIVELFAIARVLGEDPTHLLQEMGFIDTSPPSNPIYR